MQHSTSASLLIGYIYYFRSQLYNSPVNCPDEILFVNPCCCFLISSFLVQFLSSLTTTTTTTVTTTTMVIIIMIITKKKKKRTYRLVDFAVLDHYRVEVKEIEKIDQYLCYIIAEGFFLYYPFFRWLYLIFWFS